MRKNYTTLLLFFTVSLSLNAQIASYNFNDNLNDAGSNHNASYIILGKESGESPNYLASDSGKKIMLDLEQGVKLPTSINSQLDLTKSIEFNMEFTYEEFNGASEKYFITNQNGLNSPGFSVFTSHNDSNSFRIVFSYSDGKFGDVHPKHEGHAEIFLGRYPEGQKISMKIVIDFENNQLVSIINNKYSVKFFLNDVYDLDVVKNTIINDNIYLGWQVGFENEIDRILAEEPNRWGKKISIDNFDVYSPRKTGNNTALKNALTSLTNHTNGSQTLSESELESLFNVIVGNFTDNFDDVKNDIFSFINAYEANNEPIFNSYELVGVDFIDIPSKILLLFQQYMFDIELHKNVEDFQGVKYETSDFFPGKVENTAVRLNNQQVEINCTYNFIPNIKAGFDYEDTKRPTGFYVAPGDIVEVTIPTSAINKGLKAMVGAHDVDFSGFNGLNRFSRVSKIFPLNSETTKIANPFGGGIYIRVPESSNLGWINITFNNVVKSPYFSTRSGRETNLADWQTELNDNNSPWIDIESDKFMMTLPKQKLIDANITDPTELIGKWDDIMDAYRFLGGWPLERARPEYFLLDTRIGVSYGTGYPQTLPINTDFGLHPTKVLENEFYKEGFFITLHEYGHLALFPTPGLEVESNVNFPAAYIYNTQYNLSLDDALKYSLHERFTINQAMMDWLVTENFINNNIMSYAPNTENGGERLYQTRGHAKYVVMAKLFGWESVHNMNKVFYEKNITNGTRYSYWDRTTDEDIISAVSKGNNLNMMPLFHFWGLIPPAELKNELSTLPESQIILDYLNEMKTIIPKTKEEFQPYYDHIYPQKFHTLQPRLTYVLENYDTENFYDKMVNQIDYIINEYFSNLSSDSVLKESISVYPNPTKNSLNINLTSLNEENIKVLITDSLGRTILNTKKSGGKIATIDTNSFSKGVYLINLFVQNSKITYKMIKE